MAGQWIIVELLPSVDLTKFKKALNSVSKKYPLLDSLMPSNPSKKMYKKEESLFSGYIFLKMDEKHISNFDEFLVNEGLGEALKKAGSNKVHHATPEEMLWASSVLSGETSPSIKKGDLVKILSGPYTNYEGNVENITGGTASISVHIFRSTYTAVVKIDDLEKV